MSEKIIVAGVGMIPFTKPGSSEPYNIMGEKAARLALDDANIEYKKVQQAYVGYVYGDSTAGQAALYGVGLSGIPIFNVNNYCSTGSSALFLARQAIMSGNIDCALALGFEQMTPGSLDIVFEDRPNPLMRFYDEMENLQGFDERVPWAAQFFGGAGNEHIKRYGTSIETLFTFPSSSFSPSGESMYSALVPNNIDTGKNLQYLFKMPSMRSFSKNSFDSLVM